MSDPQPRTFTLHVVTPAQTLLAAFEVNWVQAQLADGGSIGIWPGHAPLLAQTVAGPLTYADAQGHHLVVLAAGIMQIEDKGITIFSRGLATDESPSPSQFERLTRELSARLSSDP